MHPTAFLNAKDFFDTYASRLGGGTIVEIGSQDVNGSIRGAAPKEMKYIGVDFVRGKGVDVVITDPYSLPFDDASVEAVVSSSCFEHSEMFWVLFLEVLRIVKPNGLVYINVPSNGEFHRFPVDCWRFYPDSGVGLVSWARMNGYQTALLESYVSGQRYGIWNDFVAVFVKSEDCVGHYPDRIHPGRTDVFNARAYGEDAVRNFRSVPEDLSGVSGRLKRWWWMRQEGKVLRRLLGDT